MPPKTALLKGRLGKEQERSRIGVSRAVTSRGRSGYRYVTRLRGGPGREREAKRPPGGVAAFPTWGDY